MLNEYAPAAMRSLCVVNAMLCLSAVSPRALLAQAAIPSAVVARSLVSRHEAPRVAIVVDESAGRGTRVAKGAGIGFLAGAVTGAIVALVAESTNSGRRSDIREGERGYAYVVMIPAGAAAGAIVGAIVGGSRR